MVSSKSFNVIGIDGSLQNFGVAVVNVDETTLNINEVVKIELSKTKPSKHLKKSVDDLARFQQHWNMVNRLIKMHDIQIAFAELPAGAKDARANFAFGAVTGMLACLPIPLITVTALEAKLASTGYKHADKEDVIAWAYSKWDDAGWTVSKRKNNYELLTDEGLYLAKENEHCADALAVTVAGLAKWK